MFKARAQRLGFEVDQENLFVEGYQQQIEKGGRLRFSTVDFAAFGIGLRDGIGHAKAFGCGLLLVRPVG